METQAAVSLDPRNYRRHSDRNKALIQKSLVECGAGRSIVVDKDNVIVAGNGVYEQAQALGLKVRVVESNGTELVVVKRTDLAPTDAKRKLLALADNQTSDTSDFDTDLLLEDFDIDLLGDWDFDTSMFDGAILDDLDGGGFIRAVKEESAVFEVSFPFPKSAKKAVDAYVKEHGKQPLVDLMLTHIKK
jgi:hypothetical protein